MAAYDPFGKNLTALNRTEIAFPSHSRARTKQDRQCTYKVTMRRVRVTIFVVERQ